MAPLPAGSANKTDPFSSCSDVPLRPGAAVVGLEGRRGSLVGGVDRGDHDPRGLVAGGGVGAGLLDAGQHPDVDRGVAVLQDREVGHRGNRDKNEDDDGDDHLR